MIRGTSLGSDLFGDYLGTPLGIPKRPHSGMGKVGQAIKAAASAIFHTGWATALEAMPSLLGRGGGRTFSPPLTTASTQSILLETILQDQPSYETFFNTRQTFGVWVGIPWGISGGILGIHLGEHLGRGRHLGDPAPHRPYCKSSHPTIQIGYPWGIFVEHWGQHLGDHLGDPVSG